MEEAKNLAIVLRAGALPAPVNIIEERVVGPSLGQDSIQKVSWLDLLVQQPLFFYVVLLSPQRCNRNYSTCNKYHYSSCSHGWNSCDTDTTGYSRLIL